MLEDIKEALKAIVEEREKVLINCRAAIDALGELSQVGTLSVDQVRHVVGESECGIYYIMPGVSDVMFLDHGYWENMQYARGSAVELAELRTATLKKILVVCQAD